MEVWRSWACTKFSINGKANLCSHCYSTTTFNPKWCALFQKEGKSIMWFFQKITQNIRRDWQNIMWLKTLILASRDLNIVAFFSISNMIINLKWTYHNQRHNIKVQVHNTLKDNNDCYSPDSTVLNEYML